MTMAKWIIIGVITSSSQPELDSSLALHLDCFQNLFALLLCTLLLHFVYLSRQLNMAIEPHLLTLCHNTVHSKLWTYLIHATLETLETSLILDIGLTVLVLGEEWSGGLQGLRLPDLVLGEHSELVLLALL